MTRGGGPGRNGGPPAARRRAPYGSHAGLGPRAIGARDEILAAAYTEIGRRGYRDTTMDDIAAAVGRSRAGVYQYFGSKGEIFLTFQYRLRVEMEQAAARLGPLGADADGYANLRTWLGEIADITKRHEVTFLQGSAAALDVEALWESSQTSVSEYTDVIARKMQEASVEGVNHRAASYAIVAMVEKAHFYRQHFSLPLSDRELTDALASVVQLVLFPGSLPMTRRTWKPRELAMLDPPVEAVIPPFVDRSTADRERARRIRDAAATVFLRKGVRRASVSDITTEAGVAHGTFYLYWRDKAELLGSLAGDMAAELNALYEKLTTMTPDGIDEGIDPWVHAFVDAYRRHVAVMAFWAAEQTYEPSLDAIEQPVFRHHVADLTTLIGRYPRAPHALPSALTVCLLALLGHYPYYTMVVYGGRGGRQLEPTLTAFLRRGFFH